MKLYEADMYKTYLRKIIFILLHWIKFYPNTLITLEYTIFGQMKSSD